ncbi:MAG: hypothetical protein KAJ86_04520 [Alphaproteobacteria bacterium]|nr:hypothetical protein [Alphaproteobacteria bacterium]
MFPFRSCRFLLLSGVLLAPLFSLGACSYTVDGSNQEITLKTPGAHNATCHVYVEGLKYKMNPPETINVFKSNKDMEIDCKAPGNRRRKVYITPIIEDSVYGNVITGILPGVAWDYASKSMFKYPSVIEVSFVGIKPRQEALPAQNNPDIKQPEEYDLEEFKSGYPRLNEDRYATPVEIKRRELPWGSYTSSSDSSSLKESIVTSPVMNGGESGGKSDLIDVIDNIGADMNPSGDPSVFSDPVSLFPGE